MKNDVYKILKIISGSAKFVSKHPVTALNELKTKVTYTECATQHDLVCMIADVGGKQYEGYAMTKKDAKKKAAEQALKDLFNIVCVESLYIISYGFKFYYIL